LAIKQNELSVKQAKDARLPILNGSASHSYAFGRSIDPTTNDFISNTFQSNNFGISTGVTLYQGGRIKNGIKQSQIDLAASKVLKEDQENAIAMEVALNYLNIILGEEQVQAAKNTLTNTRKQLDQTDRLIEAGSLPRAERLNILAQISRNEQNILAGEHAVQLAYLALKQNMEVDPTYDLKIEKPDLDKLSFDLIELSADELYRRALKYQPFMRSFELQKQSAEVGVSIAKSGFYPTVSIGGGVGTNYSNQAKRIASFNSVTSNIPIIINGATETLTTTNEIPVLENIPFGTQMNENLNEYVGLQVNVPIFNGNSTKIAVERAHLNAEQVAMNEDLRKKQLKSEIQSALLSAIAARQELGASKETLNAYEAALSNVDKRFNLGLATNLEYSTAQSNLEAARIDEIRAKYDYIFKLKIIDLLIGNPITLK